MKLGQKILSRMLFAFASVFCFITFQAYGVTLDPNLSWYEGNASALQKFIDTFGQSSKAYRSSKRPIAVFDFDNTIVKNDAGDATFFWMLAHDKIQKPKSWAETSDFLTPEAIAVLNDHCPSSLPSPLPTSSNAPCTETILSIYEDGTLPNAKTSAWKPNPHKDTLEPAYAWNVQLMAGYTPLELRSFAREAMKFNFHNEIGTKQKLGTREITASVRIYDQMKDLLSVLNKNGFDVWIVSASSQYVVEVFGKAAGVPSHHVIGVRPLLSGLGRATTSFLGCGSTPDGNKTLITYRQGKRCWINKIIFHEKDKQAQMERPSPITFAAGDSDTDVFFVKDAQELKLVINRNKPELMCNAYANKDSKWLINPMFLSPKPAKASQYDCSTYGIADQKDKVF